MKYEIIPNSFVIESVDADSQEDAICRFACTMDSDMNTYFQAKPSEKLIECIWTNDNGDIFTVLNIPNTLFNFYILKRKAYKDGTNQWNICCELANNHSKYMTLDIIRGTREDAYKRLKEILCIA